jgi:type IV fimbrial biogenesis protein FimT
MAAMNGMKFKRCASGYTLMETLIVMAIVAILGMVAVPSFKYVTDSNRLSGELNGLLGDMQYARSEAGKEGQPITVCASTSPYSQCAGSATWNTGWIVFADINSNQKVDGLDNILRTQAAFSSTDTLTADNTFQAITFNREGFANTGTANTVTASLHAATPSAGSTRCLTISPVGMLATEKYIANVCQ